MSLHMLSFRPNFIRLSSLAAKERLLPPGGDAGYALHAVFTASFGELAPKPFLLLPPGVPGGGPAGRLLAYSRASLHDLVTRAGAFADPAFSNVLDLPAAEEKAMPGAYIAGTRFGFRLRVRPVIRTGKPRPEEAADGQQTGGKARERDAYAPGGETGERPLDARGRAYAIWLAAQFSRLGGASVESTALESFCQTRLITRDRSGDQGRSTSSNGPDAILSGILRIDDGPRFAELLARGIGRHRAFGFGMLLLRPPGG